MTNDVKRIEEFLKYVGTGYQWDSRMFQMDTTRSKEFSEYLALCANNAPRMIELLKEARRILNNSLLVEDEYAFEDRAKVYKDIVTKLKQFLGD